VRLTWARDSSSEKFAILIRADFAGNIGINEMEREPCKFSESYTNDTKFSEQFLSTLPRRTP
jgi:hypothetical protein